MKYLLILFTCFSFGQFNPIFFVSGTPNQFISNWNTSNTSTGSSASNQVKLPLISTGTYSMTVFWGDGSSDLITVWNAASTTHTYSSSGLYQIRIAGTCTGWQFNDSGDKLKILSVSKWGPLKLGTNQGFYFFGCTNLVLNSVSDVLNLTGTTSLGNAFTSCLSLTTVNRMNEWNTASVTAMNGLFQACTLFNQNISNWNTGNVTTMGNMFTLASSFNQNIGAWNTASVTAMNGTFNGATAFNQNIGAWNVSNVTGFSSFMTGKTAANFSTANLDAIYNGWSSRAVKPGIVITFGSAKYTAGSSAGRAILTGAPNNWVITDGGI